jgi:undecaprenyl-diphosphatase
MPAPVEPHAPSVRPPLARALHAVPRRWGDARAALGLVVLGGLALTAIGVLLFAWLASFVVAGRTQRVDDAVMRWIGAHRIGWLEAAALELTFLGTATVVITIAGVAALFLVLSRQRTAAALLLWASIGALVLNNVVKLAFDRPRPQLFAWGTHASTTSFPSGHAMGAAAIYGTVAWLAARMTPRRGARLAIHLAAAAVVLVVAASRLYLGVHYPSDVIAGLMLGFTWAAFCAASLEAWAWMRRRRGTRRRAGDAPEDAGDPGPAGAGAPRAGAQPRPFTQRSNSRS